MIARTTHRDFDQPFWMPDIVEMVAAGDYQVDEGEELIEDHITAKLPLQRRASFQTRKGRCNSLNLRIELSEDRVRFSGRCAKGQLTQFASHNDELGQERVSEIIFSQANEAWRPITEERRKSWHRRPAPRRAA